MLNTANNFSTKNPKNGIQIPTIPKRKKIPRYPGAIVTIREISDKKKAEDERALNNRVPDTIVDNLPGMVYRSRNDPARTMEFASGGCTALTGYAPEDITGNVQGTYGALILPEDKESVCEQITAGSSGKKPFQMTYRITDRNGRIKWVWEQARGVFDDRGDLIALEGYITDISEHRLAEDALRMVNKKLHLLFGITRHDIRNQMLVLHGVISLLREMYADKKAGELIALADKAAATIDSHITFMKEYQQIGMKAPRWQNTGDVFRYAARHLFLDRVTLDADAGGFEVYADPLLGHVFFNLIDNALRHGGGVSRIDLTHRETEKNLVISVQDNGCGVPDEDKQNIFECSFGKNTGLGLFLSREILSITGITIAETGVPGNSARFEITVPEGKYRPVPCAGRI